MPDEPSERIGCMRPSQKLKSPTTDTARPDGAQTANAVPRTPSISRTWAPSLVHSSSWRPSPTRCRSSSPIVGRKRYGSSIVTVPDSP